MSAAPLVAHAADHASWKVFSDILKRPNRLSARQAEDFLTSNTPASTKPKNFCKVLNAVAKGAELHGQRPDPAVVCLFEHRAVESIHSFDATGLSIVASSFASLGPTPSGRLSQALLKRLKEKEGLRTLKTHPRSLCRVVVSLLCLRQLNSADMGELCSILQRREVTSILPPLGVANLLNAFSKIQYRDTPLLYVLSVRLSSTIRECTPMDIALAFSSFEKLEFSDRVFFGVVCKEIRFRHSNWETRCAREAEEREALKRRGGGGKGTERGVWEEDVESTAGGPDWLLEEGNSRRTDPIIKGHLLPLQSNSKGNKNKHAPKFPSPMRSPFSARDFAEILSASTGMFCRLLETDEEKFEGHSSFQDLVCSIIFPFLGPRVNSLHPHSLASVVDSFHRLAETARLQEQQTKHTAVTLSQQKNRPHRSSLDVLQEGRPLLSAVVRRLHECVWQLEPSHLSVVLHHLHRIAERVPPMQEETPFLIQDPTEQKARKADVNPGQPSTALPSEEAQNDNSSTPLDSVPERPLLWVLDSLLVAWSSRIAEVGPRFSDPQHVALLLSLIARRRPTLCARGSGADIVSGSAFRSMLLRSLDDAVPLASSDGGRRAGGGFKASLFMDEEKDRRVSSPFSARREERRAFPLAWSHWKGQELALAVGAVNRVGGESMQSDELSVEWEGKGDSDCLKEVKRKEGRRETALVVSAWLNSLAAAVSDSACPENEKEKENSSLVEKGGGRSIKRQFGGGKMNLRMMAPEHLVRICRFVWAAERGKEAVGALLRVLEPSLGLLGHLEAAMLCEAMAKVSLRLLDPCVSLTASVSDSLKSQWSRKPGAAEHGKARERESGYYEIDHLSREGDAAGSLVFKTQQQGQGVRLPNRSRRGTVSLPPHLPSTAMEPDPLLSGVRLLLSLQDLELLCVPSSSTSTRGGLSLEEGRLCTAASVLLSRCAENFEERWKLPREAGRGEGWSRESGSVRTDLSGGTVEVQILVGGLKFASREVGGHVKRETERPEVLRFALAAVEGVSRRAARDLSVLGGSTPTSSDRERGALPLPCSSRDRNGSGRTVGSLWEGESERSNLLSFRAVCELFVLLCQIREGACLREGGKREEGRRKPEDQFSGATAQTAECLLDLMSAHAQLEDRQKRAETTAATRQPLEEQLNMRIHNLPPGLALKTLTALASCDERDEAKSGETAAGGKGTEGRMASVIRLLCSHCLRGLVPLSQKPQIKLAVMKLQENCDKATLTEFLECFQKIHM
uniref:Uncharacterized protein n=1 Tax=Chromera velia CCMP2878 TaxID=1169474 RepID=A0A0G4H1Y5_9ALVE|eukprot:Cvel_24366.t1-p1 / transcript=Cvel_24366.t1 / gene=Cvel_24366 / organism=Chromera_velia_CCMP2878 / gene_product=hypothetical protein / transcript_product=hypothetical protein / location=Cvel_scaffold2623:14111-19263(-) / protein_length=1250 / sequence_SO=supercontig / SO=protein_coding / is_pseudo=false